MASFPQVSPPTPCAHLYPPPYVPHALPISFILILPPAQYIRISCKHERAIYTISRNNKVPPSKNIIKIIL
jgi:hypothetical protein